MKSKCLRAMYAVFLMIIVGICAGCGGGSSSGGLGNTVYLTPAVKDGAANVVATNTTTDGVTYTTASFNYTIKSTAYSTNNGVAASDVIINSGVITLEPVSASDGSSTASMPVVPGWVVSLSTLVPAGGSGNIDNAGVVSTSMMQKIHDGGTNGVTYNYRVNIVFKGKERNTDLNITCDPVRTTLLATVNKPSSPVQSGSVALSFDNSNPIPGSFIKATAQYDNVSGDIQNKTITIVSSNPTVIPPATAVTDSTGKAEVTIPVPSNAPKDSVVSLYAAYGSVVSKPVAVTIASSNALVLNLAPNPVFPRTVAINADASTGRVVVQGNTLTFTGPQGVIPNQNISLSIDRIDNWVNGDVVTVNGTAFSTTIPTGSVTLTTDSTGTAQIPLLVDVVLPKAAATAGQTVSHIYVIYWRATTSYGGQTYVATGSTMVTGTTTSQ